MTIHIDPNTGDVYDNDGTQFGTVSHDGPYNTSDVADVIWENSPSDNSSVSVIELKRILDVANDDIVYGTP